MVGDSGVENVPTTQVQTTYVRTLRSCMVSCFSNAVKHTYKGSRRRLFTQFMNNTIVSGNVVGIIYGAAAGVASSVSASASTQGSRHGHNRKKVQVHKRTPPPASLGSRVWCFCRRFVLPRERASEASFFALCKKKLSFSLFYIVFPARMCLGGCLFFFLFRITYRAGYVHANLVTFRATTK